MSRAGVLRRCLWLPVTPAPPSENSGACPRNHVVSPSVLARAKQATQSRLRELDGEGLGGASARGFSLLGCDQAGARAWRRCREPLKHHWQVGVPAVARGPRW